MPTNSKTKRTPPKTNSEEQNFAHLQPQAPQIEQAVLGALLIEKDAYSLISEILKPESFYDHRHELIYSEHWRLCV